MTDKTDNVLFRCTGNSARSILAASILYKEGGGRFKAYYAGSQPKGELNPYALKELDALGYPMTAHWGVEHPAAVVGTEVEIQRAFAQATQFLKNRITASIDRLALEPHVRQIGSSEGESVKSPKAE